MFARLMGLNVISPGKLQQLMQKQPVSVLDVNSQQSWLAARVPGARPLDPMGYDEIDLPANRDSTLVFYCSNFMCQARLNSDLQWSRRNCHPIKHGGCPGNISSMRASRLLLA
jgi:Rhodanese-like domain